MVLRYEILYLPFHVVLREEKERIWVSIFYDNTLVVPTQTINYHFIYHLIFKKNIELMTYLRSDINL